MHGIPSAVRVLREGDLVSLDFGAIWEGFHSDSAVTVFVGAPPSDDAKRLVEATQDALEAAIDVVRPGGRLSDIGHAIEQVAIAAAARRGSRVRRATASAARCTRTPSSRTGARPVGGRS